MRIRSRGLSDLFVALNSRLNENNKSILRLYISVCGELAEAIGSDVSNYHKKFLHSLISLLSDRSGIMKSDIHKSLEKISDQIERHTVINTMSSFLEKGSPELKIGIVEFILLKEECLKTCDL